MVFQIFRKHFDLLAKLTAAGTRLTVHQENSFPEIILISHKASEMIAESIFIKMYELSWTEAFMMTLTFNTKPQRAMWYDTTHFPY